MSKISSDELMKILMQGTHVLVGVRQDHNVPIFPDVLAIAISAAMKGGHDMTTNTANDSPLILQTKRDIPTIDSSDPFLDDEGDGRGFEILGIKDGIDSFLPKLFCTPSSLPEEVLKTSLDDSEPEIEPPTTMSLELLGDTGHEGIPVVKLPDPSFHERLAPLISYNDDPPVNIERPEPPVTSQILRHKMRSGGSYKIRLPGSELKHRIKNGEIKESRAWYLPWSTQLTTNKQPRTSQYAGHKSPTIPRHPPGAANSGGSWSTGKSLKGTPRVRPPLTPITIPKNNSPYIRQREGDDQSPRTPCFLHTRDIMTTTTHVACPYPTPPTLVYTTPLAAPPQAYFPITSNSNTLAQRQNHRGIISPSPSPTMQPPVENRDLTREYKLLLRPPEYTVLHPSPNPRNGSNIGGVGNVGVGSPYELKMPLTPISPTPHWHPNLTSSSRAFLDGKFLPMLSVDSNFGPGTTPSGTPTPSPQIERRYTALNGRCIVPLAGLSPCAETFVPRVRVAGGIENVQVRESEPLVELAPPWPPFARRS